MVAETGASITLSAVTNMLAFGVGAVTSPPEIQLFSVVNAFALFVDTAYSVTLYAAIMAECGRREMRVCGELSAQKCVEPAWGKPVRRGFLRLLDWYVDVLGRTASIVGVLSVLVVYWVVCAYVGWLVCLRIVHSRAPLRWASTSARRSSSSRTRTC